MQVFQWMRAKCMRAILFALFLALIPASSWAGVLISVGIAPPPLPVMTIADQPPCPQPGWLWTPGYWAYGPDGYYWVPGTWVPAPQVGLLWTPGYWGWNAGLYVWHPGYWGPHVGYYGGVNYGFGFFGVGFVGGAWHGGVFAYNTAVLRVNTNVIRNVYVDRTVIANHTVVNNHVAFSGGPGGVNHPPAPEERAAMNEHHFAPSAVQMQHEAAARNDRSNNFNNNHGSPSHVAMARPAGSNGHPAGSINYNASKSNNYNGAEHGQPGRNSGAANHGQSRQPQQHSSHQSAPPQHESRPAPEKRSEHGH